MAGAEAKGANWLLWTYLIGDAATFIKLAFFDCFVYTWWNWILAIPLTFIQAQLWPAYWVVIRPIFGGGCD